MRPFDSLVKPSSFFNVVLSNITPESKLMIPRKFMIAYGDNLVDCVFLKAPGGSVWQVKLESSGSQVWLTKGWPDFASYYSICIGHFLVFRYERNGHFHVIIFDTSAIEVEYPWTTDHSEDVTTDSVGRLKESGNCVPPSIKIRPVSARARSSHWVKNKLLKVASESEQPRALASAKAFRSTNPFFIKTITPSYVSSRFELALPKTFVAEYITQDCCNVILQGADRRAWSVKCNSFHTNPKFTVGWRIFVQANHLAVGDVCVFELIHRNEKVLNVIIFRAAREPSV